MREETLGDVLVAGQRKSGLFHDDTPPAPREGKPLSGADFLAHAGRVYGERTQRTPGAVEAAALNQLLSEGYEVGSLTDVEAEQLGIAVGDRITLMQSLGGDFGGIDPNEERVRRAEQELRAAERGRGSLPDGSSAYDARLQQELDRPGISRTDLAREVHRARGDI